MDAWLGWEWGLGPHGSQKKAENGIKGRRGRRAERQKRQKGLVKSQRKKNRKGGGEEAVVAVHKDNSAKPSSGQRVEPCLERFFVETSASRAMAQWKTCLKWGAGATAKAQRRGV